MAAAALFSAIGSLVYLISPVLVGSALNSHQLSLGQAGMMISSYFAGYALMAFSAIFWLHRSNIQRVALFSLLAFISGLLFGAMAGNYEVLIASMLLSGAGAGILYGIAQVAIAHSTDPDRYYGVALATQLALGSIILFLGPSIIEPHYGLAGMLVASAILAMLTAFALPWLPIRLQSDDSNQVKATDHSNLNVFAGLLALLIWFTGFSGLYTFIERIGVSGGVSSAHIGLILATTVITGMTGALLAAWVGDKLGARVPHLLGLFSAAIALALLSGVPSLAVYALAVAFLTLSWNWWLAYLFGSIASADSTGRFMVLSTTVLGLGATLGPYIAGMLLTEASFKLLFWFAGSTIFVGALIILWVVARSQLKAEVS